DLPPFTATNAVVNGNKILVTFNRDYDQSTVQEMDFIVSNGIGSPTSKQFLSADTVQLSFANPIPSGKYTLTVKNIKDLNGIAITNTPIPFIVYAPFSSGDVIINEFMYDPPAGQSEYVEIRNLSNKYLNLQN